MISLVILSGRSGSGKSTALHVLEDMGYYCIDNLPVSLLDPLIQRITQGKEQQRISVSIDARNIAEDLKAFPEIIAALDTRQVEHQIVYLDSSSETLVKRFSETRRKHPLSDNDRNLQDALELEARLLSPISAIADLTMDTTRLTIHELRDLVRSRITGSNQDLALLFQSFAFKNGVPVDADMVFDVRCLPNPHWVNSLRNLTGTDAPVQEFLASHDDVNQLYSDIQRYLDTWLPRFEENNRSYLTVAIGCTGGQHRSVYISHRLHQHFRSRWKNVQLKHRELARPPRAEKESID